MASNHKCKNISTAIQEKHVECIKFFPDQMNNIMNKDEEDPMYPLKKVIESGDINLIKVLLEMGAELYDDILFDAIQSDNPSIVKLVLMYSLDPKEDFKSKTSYMDMAIDLYFDMDSYEDILEIIELLVKYGVDYSRADDEYLREYDGSYNFEQKKLKLKRIFNEIIPFENIEYVLRDEDIKEPE